MNPRRRHQFLAPLLRGAARALDIGARTDRGRPATGSPFSATLTPAEKAAAAHRNAAARTGDGAESDILAQLEYLDAVAAASANESLLRDVREMRGRLHDELRALGVTDVDAWLAAHQDHPGPSEEPAPSGLSQATLRAAQTALYDYRFATESYLRGQGGAGDPKPEDLCCDYHRMRWEQSAAGRRNLESRLATIVAAIAEVKALIHEEGQDA